MGLWRPRSPTICYLQAGEQGSWWCDSVGSESLRTGSTHIQRQEKRDVSAQAESKFALSLPSNSIQALNRQMMPICIGKGDLLYSVS